MTETPTPDSGPALNAADWMKKATKARDSARLLLDAGDVDGAASRAYFAMFEAARAMLVTLGHPLPHSHSGLIGAFGQHVAKPGLVERELGSQLNKAEERRLYADYHGLSVATEEAQEQVGIAEDFVAAIQTYLNDHHGVNLADM